MLSSIKGLGKKAEERLNKLGVYSQTDLIHFYPRKYEQFPYRSQFSTGQIDNQVAIQAVIQSNVQHGQKNTRKLTINADGQNIYITWFGIPYIESYLWKNRTCVFLGTLKEFYGHLTMVNPKVYSIADYEKIEGKFVPIYPQTEGLGSEKIRGYIQTALTEKIPLKKENISLEERLSLGMIESDSAFVKIHNPLSEEDIAKARHRIIFDEFYDTLKSVKDRIETQKENHYIVSESHDVKIIEKNLGFELTEDQKKALSDIYNDFQNLLRPANRMIMGDVGCGKTMIAFFSMIAVSEKGYQSVLMAPTEVLATQHYEELREILSKNGLLEKYDPILLTGSLSEKEKKKIREKIEKKDSLMIIGTHALIQDKVAYSDIGLVIIDEQHRFGVNQREALLKKGAFAPHFISMSATPIPRSLSLIMYGTMEISEIKTKPSNRLPIKNCVIGERLRKSAYNFIRKQIETGRQAYIICSMVDPSESGRAEDLKSVMDHFYSIQKIFSEYKCAALHGKMKNSEKNEIMEKFSKGEFQILISTTVVEVGVNVPNATVIMIEDANRFGLLQLHQLRGRVGRGKDQSYCIFLDQSENTDNERLRVLEKTNDGFFIAKEDLRLRGSGELLGERQSGQGEFLLGDPVRDEWIMKEVLSLLQDDFQKTAMIISE